MGFVSTVVAVMLGVWLYRFLVEVKDVSNFRSKSKSPYRKKDPWR